MNTLVKFEWDAAKATRNREKHGVSFEEAATVFDDPLLIAFIDEEHSIHEERFITVGLSKQGKLLVVAHTERKGRVRIFRARKATRKEEAFYEETA